MQDVAVYRALVLQLEPATIWAKAELHKLALAAIHLSFLWASHHSTHTGRITFQAKWEEKGGKEKNAALY